VREYNNYRPLEALGNKTPASVHVHSEREYNPVVSHWDYPREFPCSPRIQELLHPLGSRSLAYGFYSID
jgi:hypothetical protein